MPTTPNLGITHIEQNQSSKEVTANAAFDRLDEATQDTVDIDASAGGTVVVASADYLGNFRLHLTGTPAGAFTLQVPNGKRVFLVDNASGQSATVQRAGGGGTVSVVDGEAFILMNTGSDIIAIGAASLPVSDTIAIVKGSGDASKLLRFEVDGFTTATTRVATMPDKDGTVAMLSDLPQFAGARAYNSAAISVSSGGAGTVLSLDSERYDTDAFHSTVTNTSRLTVPSGKGGKYRVTGNARFAGEATATGERRLEILLNGTTVIAAAAETDIGTQAVTLNVSCDYDLAVNDYVELRAFQDSGGALNVEAAGNLSPEFMIANFGGASAKGGWEPIGTKSLSAVASADFTTGIDATYNRYVFVLDGIVVSNDGAVMQVRVSTDGGSTFKAGASDYKYTLQWASSAGTNGIASSNGASEIAVSATGNAAGEHGNWQVTLSKPADAALFTTFGVKEETFAASGNLISSHGAGAYVTAAAVDAIRFLVSAGTFSGEISLYGIRP